MIVTELIPIPDAALPLDAFKAHLRLGRGFGTESLQDQLLHGFLRASLAAIEARTGKMLIIRPFSLVATRWRNDQREPLPVVPVQQIIAITTIGADQTSAIWASETYHLEADPQVPRLCPTGACLPRLKKGAQVRVDISAGLAVDFASLPGDLAQAVLMLAAHYYEHRDATGLHGGCMPFGVTSLIERHRVVRLAAGARL